MTKVQPAAGGKRKAAVRYYRFRNRLKEKATGGKGGTAPGRFGTAALEAAEAEFDRMAEDYPDWVQGHITRLYEQHGRCVDTPEQRHTCFRNLNEIAHDMKGQGGTFGYPLISHFGDSLYRCTKRQDEYTDNHVEIVKAHIDAMKAVIAGRIKGDGGALGKELIASLDKAIAKYSDVMIG